MSDMPCALMHNTTNDSDALERAVAEVGDGWSLRIAWAIARNVTRFDALQRELGVARNILSERLRRLTQAGLIEKRPITAGARRMEYCLTPKGAALTEALEALCAWSHQWLKEPMEVCHIR